MSGQLKRRGYFQVRCELENQERLFGVSWIYM